MSNEKKVTAVEWLVEELEQHHTKIDIKNTVVFQQAKEMEKEQMDKVSEDWFVEGCSHMKDNKRIYQSFEQYYKETYSTK
jgi:hypothetical protein